MPFIHIVKQKRGMKNIMDTVWGHYHDTNLFHLDILDFLGGNILQFLKQVHNYYMSGKLDRKVVGPPLHIKFKMSSKIQISQPPPKYQHTVTILNFPLTFSMKNYCTLHFHATRHSKFIQLQRK